MPRGQARQSLTRRLFWVMVTALSALAIGLGVVGTILIGRVVEQSFDKLLGASVEEIAGTVVAGRGGVAFDIPPSALGMLENNERDNVYYRLQHGQRLLTGYADLPTPSVLDTGPGERMFGYAVYKGQRVRIAAERRYLPRISDPVTIEVAQTLGERRSLELVMVGALYLLELSFIVIGGLLVWPTLKWGLRPVNRIREELNARPTDRANFAPLSLTHAPTELVGLVGGFNHLLERLEGAVAGMRQFTADASHQMRTPLAVLKTHLSVLSQDVAANSPQAGALQDVRTAVDRLEALLMRLIALAHADEALRGGISRSRIDLRSVIVQVTGELMPLAVQRNIALAVNAQRRPAWANADPILAAEILTNLIENAIHYNRPGGNVCICVHEAAQFIGVSVEDDGPGIPEAQQQHVFERFYRLPRDQAQPGSGLGLAIVKALSEALHARVTIDPPPSGRGLKISVQFERAVP